MPLNCPPAIAAVQVASPVLFAAIVTSVPPPTPPCGERLGRPKFGPEIDESCPMKLVVVLSQVGLPTELLEYMK